MRTVSFRMLAVLALTLVTGDAAADLFINGENVTGIRNVSLVNVRVRIDERGNVYLEAPGYSVRRVDVANANASSSQGPASQAGRGQGPAVTQAPAQSQLTRRYYIVTNETGPSQYDIEVFVNGTSAARSRAGGDPVIDLLNRFLRPGRNEIRVVAHKVVEGGRRSDRSAFVHRVLIGEGSESQGQVTLDSTFVDYSVNASQAGDQTSVFTITAR